MKHEEIKFIDLFAGIGGFRLGLERVNNEHAHVSQKPQQKERTQGGKRATVKQGIQLHSRNRTTPFRCVWTNEWDKYAAQIYNKNYSNEYSASGRQEQSQMEQKPYMADTTSQCTEQSSVVDTRDITTVDAGKIPDHDLLCGGFPCQSFSIAGKRKGFDDTRGTLFFEIARIAKAKKPKYMLLENVKGLVSHDKGRTLTTILESLQELGYYVNWEIYNSKDFDVPQNRERIIFICKHINVLASVGQNKRITSSEKIIQEYLFQLLLNNLKEVEKLQEHASKDWVVGYLLSKEIYQSQKLNGENTRDGITIPTAGSMFQSKEKEVWQNIDTWLNNSLGVNCSELNLSTMSTVIKKITESKTYTFLKMQQLIWLATVALRRLQPDLWNQVLLSLIVIPEGTKYARINNQNKEIIITETYTAHDPAELQKPERYFSLGHLRGTPGPKVFPIGSDDKPRSEQDTPQTTGVSGPIRSQGDKPMIANTLTSNYWKGPAASRPLVQDVKIRRLTPTECERLQGFPDGWTEGISDTQRYKCLGNAVTVNVITEIAKRYMTVK